MENILADDEPALLISIGPASWSRADPRMRGMTAEMTV